MADEELELNYRHFQFVQEYLIDYNGTRAYSAVYPDSSKEAAETSAVRLLRNDRVQKAIEQGAEEKIKRSQITQDRVLNEMARIGFQDIRKLYDQDGNLKPIHELDDDTAACIAGVEVQEMAGDAQIGGDAGIKYIAIQTKKVKCWPKDKALADIGKHLGMFPNKTELDIPAGFTINIGDKDAGNL